VFIQQSRKYNLYQDETRAVYHNGISGTLVVGTFGSQSSLEITQKVDDGEIKLSNMQKVFFSAPIVQSPNSVEVLSQH